ncbi:hypothetical protein Hdeb2414_s0025g00655671 [Helianthus debilis subsp. tardiflorus]
MFLFWSAEWFGVSYKHAKCSKNRFFKLQRDHLSVIEVIQRKCLGLYFLWSLISLPLVIL